MMREKITRWAEQTALRHWHDLEMMIVIWTRRKEKNSDERRGNKGAAEKIEEVWEWSVE